jgi:hypothetical protein
MTPDQSDNPGRLDLNVLTACAADAGGLVEDNDARSGPDRSKIVRDGCAIGAIDGQY